MFDDILFSSLHADETLAAPTLLAVLGQRRAFHITRVGRGDNDVLVGNQVLDAEFAAVFDDLSAALVAVFLANRLQFINDDRDE